MMYDRKYDVSTGQFVLTSTGDVARANLSDTLLSQTIDIALTTYVGTYVFDPSFGTPWNQRIFGKKSVSEDTVKRVLSEVIKNVPGVLSVSSVSFTRDGSTREGTIEWTVVGSNGSVSGETGV
jgi:hypothetical protein